MPKFTDRSLKALTVEPGRKDRIVFDDECPGLGIRVTAKSKTFLVQWTDRATKRKVREKLDVWGNITIEGARNAARIKLGEVAKGMNPAAERKKLKAEAEVSRAEQALTLDKLIKQWTDLHLASCGVRYRREAPRSLRFNLQDYLQRPAARMTKADVISVLDNLSQVGRNATARVTVSYGKACYEWAQRRGRVSHNPFEALPVAISRLERDRVLTDAELAEVWAAAGALSYPYGPLYRFALLTLQRREEVGGMRWSELSEDGSVWTIAASRMKNGRPHDVHLPPAAREILATIPRLHEIDLIFTTNGKVSVADFSGAKERIDALILAARAEVAEESGLAVIPLPPWRFHDFRRTGVSRLAAMGFDSIVADKILAHKPAKLKGVASVYQRHDFASERRRALEAWAEHVAGASASGNVVQLRRSS